MPIIPWLVMMLGLILVAAALVPVAVAWIESRQARRLQDLEPYPRALPAPPGRTAVVYFSRSGNTALVARHVARRLNARLFPLEAPDYRLGLPGWVRAMRDARGHAAELSPRTIDLGAFDTVYLGSPVWLYSPAPPLWDFVEHNRFDGQRVVLFNTFNSRFRPEHIEAFRARAMQHGARSFEHRVIRRGRMTRQLTPDAMLRAIDAEWFSGGEPPPPPAAR